MNVEGMVVCLCDSAHYSAALWEREQIITVRENDPIRPLLHCSICRDEDNSCNEWFSICGQPSHGMHRVCAWDEDNAWSRVPTCPLCRVPSRYNEGMELNITEDRDSLILQSDQIVLQQPHWSHQLK